MILAELGVEVVKGKPLGNDAVGLVGEDEPGESPGAPSGAGFSRILFEPGDRERRRALLLPRGEGILGHFAGMEDDDGDAFFLEGRGLVAEEAQDAAARALFGIDEQGQDGLIRRRGGGIQAGVGKIG